MYIALELLQTIGRELWFTITVHLWFTVKSRHLLCQ